MNDYTKNFDPKEYNSTINLSTSADDILDVSPVNSTSSSCPNNNDFQIRDVEKNGNNLQSKNSFDTISNAMSGDKVILATETKDEELDETVNMNDTCNLDLLQEYQKFLNDSVGQGDNGTSVLSSDDDTDTSEKMNLTKTEITEVDNHSFSIGATILPSHSQQSKSVRNSSPRESSESEWDKALQSGKPFSGRADANFFLPRSQSTTPTTGQRFRRHPGAQKSVSATPTSSHHRRNSSLSSNASSFMIQDHYLQPVQEDSDNVVSTSLASNTSMSENKSQAGSASLEIRTGNNALSQSIDPPPRPPQSNENVVLFSHGSGSRPSSPKAIIRNPTISVTTQMSPRSGRAGSNLHYPLSLQRRPIHVQSRRTSAGSIASVSSGLGVPHNNTGVVSAGGVGGSASVISSHSYHSNDNLSSGVLPDILLTVRQKIESMTLFDSDILKLMSADYKNQDGLNTDDDPTMQESRESLKRSSQQSISASVLVSLAHKRYERRRLAAMEIEKVVRSLVVQHQHQSIKNQQQVSVAKKNNYLLTSPVGDMALERIRAILLLLSDDYVRSTSEDARKGGVVALAACAIGLKKADDSSPSVQECRDLILASVVHACQDHSQRVRYYATESLFNVVKVIPSLAVQHFFILFEILRSLYADVDIDVRSGAELLDKKLKEIIVGAMNAGIFTADACVPVFSRFVFMKHKATKRLTLTWLQELNEKLIGSPILEFLHLFLGGIFDMVADPTVAIRQSALAFLQSVLPRLLVVKHDVDIHSNPNSASIGGPDKAGKGYNSMFDNMEDIEMNVVDFDKILQSLVTTMEHPNPFVRKVAMYWMSRIVKAHMTSSNGMTALNATKNDKRIFSSEKSNMMNPVGGNTAVSPDNHIVPGMERNDCYDSHTLSAASIAVRNSVPHVLPGILLRYAHTSIFLNLQT
jgi:Vacuolar 14 Fab1-binding region